MNRYLALVFLTVAMTAVGMPAALAAPTCMGRTATIVGTKGPDTLTGTAGDDVIVGLSGGDHISGRGGNDRICAGRHKDVVLGGAGNDRLRGGGTGDVLEGGAGNDVLRGGSGFGNHLRGGDGNDIVVGGDNEDDLFGEAGADRLHGGGENDSLSGGPGDDMIDGGAHSVSPPIEWTKLHDGNTLWFCSPGAADARCDEVAGAHVDLSAGTAVSAHGRDTLVRIQNVWGTLGDDVLIGDDGANELIPRNGSDTVRSLGGDDVIGNSHTAYGDGPDTAPGDDFDGGSGADLVTDGIGASAGGAGADSVAGQGVVRGGGGDDILGGWGEASVQVHGDDGDDVLHGTVSDDLLSGGAGNDELTGYDGNDAADGGSDDDLCRAETTIGCETVQPDPTTGS